MSKVITDEKRIDFILNRGVENIFVKESLKNKLLSGKKLKIYLGIDPTGPTLHMGHVIPIMKLKQFQELGHEVILLIGDFTAMIGDPTDKMATRIQLTHKEVLNNCKNYKKQASKFLKFNGNNPAKFKFNSKWLAKMKFEDVLNLASKITVDQMLKRDMFVRRQEENKPIFGHEFFYPLMQGYDSVAMDIDIEIGGNDQTFNMLMGRNLVSEILKKDKSVITMKLLEDNTGKKMGKTEGNMISFLDNANEMFGKIMSWNDGLILKGFELCTDLEEKYFPNMQNPRDAKLKLAFEIVKIYHGEKKAQEAQINWENTFSKKEIPDEMEEIKVNAGEILMEVLVDKKVLSSKGEYRRLVEGNAVHDLEKNENIKDVNFKVLENLTLKIGKKRFLKINVN
ncbi:tyrosine--tRNA ligase [Candidatus Nomurabacteria bacterium]|nr:tyrosine--tRNA ligase [Candidatus Nomurabacteria bacterium]